MAIQISTIIVRFPGLVKERNKGGVLVSSCRSSAGDGRSLKGNNALSSLREAGSLGVFKASFRDVSGMQASGS